MRFLNKQPDIKQLIFMVVDWLVDQRKKKIACSITRNLNHMEYIFSTKNIIPYRKSVSRLKFDPYTWGRPNMKYEKQALKAPTEYLPLTSSHEELAEYQENPASDYAPECPAPLQGFQDQVRDIGLW